MNTHRLGSSAIASTLAALLTSACGEPAPSDPAAAPIGGALNKISTQPAGVQKADVVQGSTAKVPSLQAKPIAQPIAKPAAQAPIGVVKPVEIAPGKINGINCGAACGGSCGEPEDDAPPSKELVAKPAGAATTVVGPTPKLAAPTVAPATTVKPPQPGPTVLPPKPE